VTKESKVMLYYNKILAIGTEVIYLTL